MLTPVDVNDADSVLTALLRGIVATDSERGVLLRTTRGQSRRGTGRNYILEFPEREHAWMGHIKFKAQTDADAIAIAEKKIARNQRWLQIWSWLCDDCRADFLSGGHSYCDCLIRHYLHEDERRRVHELMKTWKFGFMHSRIQVIETGVYVIAIYNKDVPDLVEYVDVISRHSGSDYSVEYDEIVFRLPAHEPPAR